MSQIQKLGCCCVCIVCFDCTSFFFQLRLQKKCHPCCACASSSSVLQSAIIRNPLECPTFLHARFTKYPLIISFGYYRRVISIVFTHVCGRHTGSVGFRRRPSRSVYRSQTNHHKYKHRHPLQLQPQSAHGFGHYPRHSNTTICAHAYPPPPPAAVPAPICLRQIRFPTAQWSAQLINIAEQLIGRGSCVPGSRSRLRQHQSGGRRQSRIATPLGGSRPTGHCLQPLSRYVCVPDVIPIAHAGLHIYVETHTHTQTQN